MIRASSHLLCTMVVGSALWGCVVVLFACSRLSINFKVTRDMTIDCLSRSDSMDPRVVREVIDSRPTNHTTLDKYAHEIFTQPRNPSSLTSMCTMVMLTYRRERVLTFLLNHYCKVRSLHKIIIIWNDVDRSIPDDIVDIRDDCVTELLFIREKKNKLTNRFKPRPEIETECEILYFRSVYMFNIEWNNSQV